MIATTFSESRFAHTSAAGPMHWPSSAMCTEIIGTFDASIQYATVSTHRIYVPFEPTATGPARQIHNVHPETTGEAILEIRRRSGLTWEELGDLFDVSRRSIHHWASGKVVSAKNDQLIRRTLTVIRQLDRGEAARTRAALLTTNDEGFAILDFLKAGSLEEAIASCEVGNAPAEQRRIPLSQAARDLRRQPAPAMLLEANEERPEVPAQARKARALRMPKATG